MKHPIVAPAEPAMRFFTPDRLHGGAVGSVLPAVGAQQYSRLNDALTPPA